MRAADGSLSTMHRRHNLSLQRLQISTGLHQFAGPEALVASGPAVILIPTFFTAYWFAFFSTVIGILIKPSTTALHLIRESVLTSAPPR